MQQDWVETILRQCRQAKVPFFFKQWGGVMKHRTGRQLHGRTYDEMPVPLRVRPDHRPACASILKRGEPASVQVTRTKFHRLPEAAYHLRRIPAASALRPDPPLITSQSPSNVTRNEPHRRTARNIRNSGDAIRISRRILVRSPPPRSTRRNLPNAPERPPPVHRPAPVSVPSSELRSPTSELRYTPRAHRNGRFAIRHAHHTS